MAFFKKLKARLFRSSSKLEEGLDAIVEDGGAQEAQTEVDANEPDIAQSQEPQSPPSQEAPADETLADEPPSDEPVIDAPAMEEPVIEETPHQPVEVEPAENIPSEPIQPEDPEPEASEEPTKALPKSDDKADPGLIGRLMGRRAQAPVMRRTLDDDMLEQLEELLIASDMGVDTALRVTANLAEGRYGKKLSVEEIKQLLSDEITRIMEPVAKALPIYPKRPQVVLVVGVNGSGKTTTIGKLASQFRAAGKSVVIAAGDTFRAAAVEQLQIWGERAGVPVLTAPEGSDPASLAFDSITKAQAEGADLLMIDTAGRLQNRADLMEELSKIVRVIRKKDPDAPHNTLLVLDATTGQNALSQVETFKKLADVTGLVMTKLDGTAKGGVLVALADKFGLPIHAIGVGEQIDDLAPFDPEDFAKALTGQDL